MDNFQTQRCWCYRDLDGRCNKEPPPAVAQLDLELLGRKVTGAAVEDYGWEREEMDND